MPMEIGGRARRTRQASAAPPTRRNAPPIVHELNNEETGSKTLSGSSLHGQKTTRR